MPSQHSINNMSLLTNWGWEKYLAGGHGVITNAARSVRHD